MNRTATSFRCANFSEKSTTAVCSPGTTVSVRVSRMPVPASRMRVAVGSVGTATSMAPLAIAGIMSGNPSGTTSMSLMVSPPVRRNWSSEYSGTMSRAAIDTLSPLKSFADFTLSASALRTMTASYPCPAVIVPLSATIRSCTPLLTAL